MECRFINLHSILGLALLQDSLVIPVGVLDTLFDFICLQQTLTLRMLNQTARMRDHLDTI